MNLTDENTTLWGGNYTTTTTGVIENLDMVYIVLFGTVFGSIAFICCGIFSCNSCSARNRTFSQTTCMLLFSLFIDFVGLLICHRPRKDHYYNQQHTGLCDEYNFSMEELIKCKCKKKKPPIYIEQLFEVVTTQPVDMEEICIICYEPLGENKHKCGKLFCKHEYGELHCKHKFHKECIKEWMEKSINKDCPICRS
jgi:hypothetical protein